MGITKPCTQPNSAPSTSNQLISTSTQLHPPAPSSFQPPPSYKNQNISRNGAISPNLGRKIQSCPCCLKTGTHCILEVLIPNPDLQYRNSNPKIHFWANLDRKSQSCLVSENWHTRYLGGIDSESGLRFSKLRPQNPFLGTFGPKKSKLSVLPENCHIEYLEDADSYSDISFPNF